MGDEKKPTKDDSGKLTADKPSDTDSPVMITRTLSAPKGSRMPALPWGRVSRAVLTLALVLGVGFGVYHFATQPKVIFTVAGKSYRADYVSKVLAYPILQGENRDSVTKQMFTYLKEQQAAAKLNIVPNKAEIDSAARSSIGNNDINLQDPWLQLSAYHTALTAKLDATNGGDYKGYTFIFWFGQHLEKGYHYTAPDYGNKDLVAKDRAYAKDRADFYHKQLAANKITANEAIAQINSDPKLNLMYATNSTLSKQFGNDSLPWREKVYFDEVGKYIASQKTTGLSAVRVGKASIVPAPQSDADYAEMYFYITRVDKADPATQAEFAAAVNAVKAEYKGW